MNSLNRRAIIQRIVDELDHRFAKLHGKTVKGHHTDLYPDGTSEEWTYFTDGSRARFPQAYEEYLETCIDLIESVSSESEFFEMIKTIKAELIAEKSYKASKSTTRRLSGRLKTN